MRVKTNFFAMAYQVLAGLLLLLAQTGLAHESKQDCIKALSSYPEKRVYDSPEQQVEYIRLIQTSEGREQARAFEALYANYAAMIEGMAGKSARNLNKFRPGNFEEYAENFRQIGRLALYEAALKYNLAFPKPGSYIHRYVYYFMLATLTHRDGEINTPLLMRKLNQKRRNLLFAGRIQELYNDMDGKISHAELKSLHALFSTRVFSLNEPVSDESAAERADQIPDDTCNILETMHTKQLQTLVTKAMRQVMQSLSPRDRKIAEGRTFCESEEALSARELAPVVGASHETVRLVDIKIRTQLKSTLKELILNQNDFLKTLSDDEADIAKQRIFAASKKTRAELAEWLGWPELRILETEKQIAQKYEKVFRRRLIELLARESDASER